MNVQSKITSIISELQNQFFERDHIIKAAWTAILSKQHMLQLGLPGTAKSQLTNAICRRIEGSEYFERLLTRFSTPEELFGPVSLKGMENDDYRRIVDNMLPTAHIAFVDEIFKCNSALLNSLLTIINERKFDNGRNRLSTPLISVFGASNELPEDKELDALFDRFILRFDVPYLSEGANWEALMMSALNGNHNSANTTITLDELANAQEMVAQVGMQESIVRTMRDIKMQLESDGIRASDRRWKQTVRVLQAWAWIHNRDRVEISDLELLCDMLWTDPSQRSTLVSTILTTTNPLDLEAVKLHDDCMDVFSRYGPDISSAEKEEIMQKLRAAMGQIDDKLKIADPAKANKMKEVRGKIKGWYGEALKGYDI